MTNPALAAPIPVPDPDSGPYWEGLKNGKLMLCRCDDTGKWIHPPLERSRYTGGPVHFEAVSGDGTIFSYIVVRQALVPGRVPPMSSVSSNSRSSRDYGSMRSSMPIRPTSESVSR